jgi:hypothetical protein
MEIIKELLKSSGLAILLAFGALYLFGWQYYLAFFHALDLPMFLVLPPEIAIGKGVHPAVVFLCVAIVAWGAGWSWSTLCQTRSGASPNSAWARRTALAPGFAGSLGLIAPVCLAMYSAVPKNEVPVLGLDLGTYFSIAMPTVGLAALVAFIAGRNWMRDRDSRHDWYFFLALAFLASGCLYAGILGRKEAIEIAADSNGLPYPNQPRRARVNLRFKESSLQSDCGSRKFIPILITQDELVLMSADTKGTMATAATSANQSSICSMPGDSPHAVVMMKKDIVQILSITKNNATESGSRPNGLQTRR